MPGDDRLLYAYSFAYETERIGVPFGETKPRFEEDLKLLEALLTRAVRANRTTLAMEGIFAFVLESAFLGLLVYGEQRLGRRGHFMAAVMGRDAWWSVPLAVLVGVPMYSNAAGVIPIVQALLAKGAALGTVLAFMMSVIALSLPEMIILRKVLKVRLTAKAASAHDAAQLLDRWDAEVRAIMGEPDSVAFGDWIYGLSSVTFGYGVVVDYDSPDGSLTLC